MSFLRRLWLMALLLCGAWVPASADEFRPAYLQLTQTDGSSYEVLWKLPALPEESSVKPPLVLLKSTYGITRYKVTLWVHEVPGGKAVKWPETHRFVPLGELAALPMPSPYRRALEKLLVSQGEFRLE